MLGKELPEFFDYSTIKRRPSRFLDFFYRIDPIRHHNKKTIEFLDPEQQNMRYSDRESGFHYYYADGRDWFPDYGPEALLLGELYPNKNAQELYGIYGRDEVYRYGGLFEQLEEEKPGAMGKYIRYFRDYYHYVDKKGELIKKYKQLV